MLQEEISKGDVTLVIQIVGSSSTQNVWLDSKKLGETVGQTLVKFVVPSGKHTVRVGTQRGGIAQATFAASAGDEVSFVATKSPGLMRLDLAGITTDTTNMSIEQLEAKIAELELQRQNLSREIEVNPGRSGSINGLGIFVILLCVFFGSCFGITMYDDAQFDAAYGGPSPDIMMIVWPVMLALVIGVVVAIGLTNMTKSHATGIAQNHLGIVEKQLLTIRQQLQQVQRQAKSVPVTSHGTVGSDSFSGDLEEKLANLRDLKEKGVIDDEEYKLLRRKVIDGS